MIGVEWFRYEREWHAITLTDPRRAECGLTMVNPPRVTAGTAESPLPPRPCIACAVAAQERFMEAEPLSEALARGFRPFRGEAEAEGS